MQMRSPESLNLWKSEYTLQIRCRGLCFELGECRDLFKALIYLAKIKEPCDATVTQTVERCTFCFVILYGSVCNSFKRGQVDSTQWQVTWKDDSFNTSLCQGSPLTFSLHFFSYTLGWALQSHNTCHAYEGRPPFPKLQSLLFTLFIFGGISSLTLHFT